MGAPRKINKDEKDKITLNIPPDLRKRFHKYCYDVKKSSMSAVIQKFMIKILEKRGM
jgi:hypothetical protein